MKAYRASLLLVLLLLHIQPHEFIRRSIQHILNDFKSLRIEKGYNMFYLGESLTLYCHKSSGFVGNVTFKSGNDFEPDELVDKINSTDACLCNKTITKDHVARGSENFQCLDESKKFLASERIKADYRPRNATNLQVVWLNKTVLNLSWDFGGVHYRHATVKAEWRLHSHNKSDWEACTRESDMNCRVSNVSGFTDDTTILFVRVNVTNAVRGDSAVHVFPPVNLADHAKPLPVTGVKVRSLSGRSVEVSATAEQSELNYTIAFNSSQQDSFGRHDSGVKVTGLTEEKTWEVSGLHPSYTYRFDVRAQFLTGLRSDPPAAVTQFQMPEDVPASGPIIPPVAYYLDESRCSSGPSDSTATAYIYFQDIRQEDQNGVIRNYTARVEESSVTDTKRGDEPRTFTLQSVACGRREFVVTMVGSTDVGESPPTSLSVFAGQGAKDVVEKLHFMVRVSGREEEVRAEWVPPPPALPPRAAFSLFLYYCKAGQDNNLCQDGIQYVEVEASEGHHRLEGASTGMKFGVAVLMADSNATSGIHFTRCLYNPAVAADKPPRDLKAYYHQQRSDIEVQWSGQTCDSLVEVCQAPDHTDCRNHTVDWSIFSYTVKGVETGKEYRIRLWANTTSEPESMTPSSTAQVSPNTERRSGNPSDAVLVVIFIAVILVSGMFVCCCVFRDKMKTKMSKFMPSIPENFGESRNFSSPDRESEGGVTNLGYSHSSHGASFIAQRTAAVTEAQSMGEGGGGGERREDSQPTPPALDHPRDHIWTMTDTPHGTACHSAVEADFGTACHSTMEADFGTACHSAVEADFGTACHSAVEADFGTACHSAVEADAPARAETCGLGMEIPLVTFTGLRETALREERAGTEEKGRDAADNTDVDDDNAHDDAGYDGDDAGAVHDASEKSSLSAVRLAPVGSSTYVKHAIAQSPCQSSAREGEFCAQRDGQYVPPANEIGQAGRLGGESCYVRSGNDPDAASCPSSLGDDDDDLSLSDDDQSDGITVHIPPSFSAVAVMGDTSGEGRGGD